MTDISIIVPMYNEQEVLPTFFRRIREVFDTSEILSKKTYEIVCIDDGSSDGTLSVLENFSLKDEHIKYISFSRNFGKESAILAGLSFCSGANAVPIDADLQDPPELISEFIAKIDEGYDVAYGIRIDRSSDTKFKRTTSEWFYKIYNAISDRPIPRDTGDFRMITRRVIDAVLSLREKSVFMKGIFNWVGFKSVGVTYERPARVLGKTKWNYWKLWNFALDGITASSTLPLRIWTYVGGAVAGMAGVYAFYIVARTLVRGVDVPGYASLLVSILFFGAIQLIALGIFGEYLGRVVAEVRGRPRYIIEKLSLNLSDSVSDLKSKNEQK